MFTPYSRNITVALIYKKGKEHIDELCLSIPDISKAAILVPNIGETFIDRKRNEEYEVEDVIRSIDGDEYIIQVQLKKREHKKYRL